MLEKAKAIVGLFHRRGYKTFFIGGKPRNDAKNSGKAVKYRVNNIDILTSASKEDIQKIFPLNRELDLTVPAISITFADQQFKVFFFIKDQTKFDDKFISIKSTKIKPKLQHIKCLDDIRSKLDFTINTLVQETHGTVIDFSYEQNGKLISALNDIRKETIRAINGKQTFIDDPRRILRMFKFESMLQFKIDPDTFKDALSCKDLITNIPIDILLDDFNIILTSPGVKNTIKSMKKFGFFNIGDKPFMNIISKIPEKNLDNLEKYCNMTTFNIEEKMDLIEAYALLLFGVNADIIRSELSAYNILNEDDIERVIWLVKHQDILDCKDLRMKIFNARDGLVERDGQLGLLILMRKIAHIAKMLYGQDAYNKIYGAFCERPYFFGQLRVTNEDIASFIDKELSTNPLDNQWVEDIKEAILKRLINITGDWPYSYDTYMQYVSDGIKDIFPDANITIPEEVKMVDDYGNTMDHAKAIQHERVPITDEDEDLIVKAAEDKKVVHANELDSESENDFEELVEEYTESDADDYLVNTPESDL